MHTPLLPFTLKPTPPAPLLNAHTDLDGTAFGNEYATHKWSPQQLAEAERGLLRFVNYAIPGVNTPML